MSSLLTYILHYGNPALTRKVHEALMHKAVLTQNTDLVVLDNAAPKPYEGAIRLERNIFWAGALAYALRSAESRGFEYVWFCNNDITFMSAAPLMAKVQHRLTLLAKALENPIGILTPSVTASPYLAHMVHQKGLSYSIVPCVDGIAPVISIQCLRELGGLKTLGLAENTRGYGLDIWLSLQAHKAGWAVVVDHTLLVRHTYHTTLPLLTVLCYKRRKKNKRLCKRA